MLTAAETGPGLSQELGIEARFSRCAADPTEATDSCTGGKESCSGSWAMDVLTFMLSATPSCLAAVPSVDLPMLCCPTAALVPNSVRILVPIYPRSSVPHLSLS